MTTLLNKDMDEIIIEKMRHQVSNRSVIQMTITGRVINTYYSISEAHRQTGVSRSAISNALAKKSGMRYSGGYTWAYEKDVI